MAVADIRAEGAQKVADAAAGEARGYACDVSDSAAVRQLFEAVASDLGDVDVLVNNAGIARRNQEAQERMLGQMQAAMTGGERESLGATKELSDEDWDRMLRIHLYGTFYCTREALKVMEPQPPRSDRQHLVRRGAAGPARARPTTRPRRPGSSGSRAAWRRRSAARASA